MNGNAMITEQEFSHFQRFIYESAGITLPSSKKMLVSSRLARRLQHYEFNTYSEYFKFLKSGDSKTEIQTAIDLLTTNETYFFREPKHFDLLKEQALAARNRVQSFRVWSAACSSGEEAYSAAMVLADSMEGTQWDVFGCDISARVLQRAATGHFSMERTKNIPAAYMRRYCLKGIDAQQGTLLIERDLRSKVRFSQVNLNETLPDIGMFDIVFLRNVMIYFNDDTKRQVVERVVSKLKPGGYLLISHSETLNGISTVVVPVSPSVYRKL